MTAMEDLRDACERAGSEIVPRESDATARLLLRIGEGDGRDPEGFSYRPMGRGSWEIVGRSRMGCARGLSFVADRIRVIGRLPDTDVAMNPAFPLRFCHLGVASIDLPKPPFYDETRFDTVLERAEADIKRAFLYGANHLLLHATYRISDWSEGPHRERTEIYRHLYSDIARISHRYGLKCLVIGDEFLYQEPMIKAQGIGLSPEDRKLWGVLKERYRGILDSVPELDGIGTRIGEVLPIGDIRAFDIVHNESPLSLEEKYRRFVTTMREVVVDEFDKLYYHRTWVVNDWEQHSVESIFKSIFDQVPTEKTIVSIKLTKCDQWWYQALNPTFGQTGHLTSVELEMAHGPHGSMRYPDYMGEWFQAGLNYALGRGAKAALFGFPSTLWMDAHHYAAMRLLWNPRLSSRELARDWAAKTFGRPASRAVGEMLLLSDDAMEKALYIRPYASTHAWNPLEHLITGLFVVKGDPTLDGGKEHASFLRETYLLCKPHFQETLDEMRRGLEIYDRMLELFSKAKVSITGQGIRNEALQSLREGRLFLRLNVAYVSAFLHFFRYEDEESEEAHRKALGRVSALRKALEAYQRGGGRFETIGIETFLELSRKGLEDLASYREMLDASPGAEEMRQTLTSGRRRDESLSRLPQARRIAHFEIDVDGAELLVLRRRSMTTKHISCEPSKVIAYEFYDEIPQAGHLVVRPLEARGWVYVAEQPSEVNGHTLKIVIQDPQAGRSVYAFDIYAVPVDLIGPQRDP